MTRRLIERTLFIWFVSKTLSSLREYQNDKIYGHVREFVTLSIIPLDNIFIRFGSRLYRQIAGIPKGTNCAPLVAEKFFWFAIRETSCCLFLIKSGWCYWRVQRMEEGKYQESIQSSTTPVPRHQMGKWEKHQKTSHTREPRGRAFPSKWLQGCKEQTRQYDSDSHKTQITCKYILGDDALIW